MVNAGKKSAALAVAVVSVLGIAGCAPGDGVDGEVTISVGTFNDAGFADVIFEEYEALNPGVTIIHNKAATTDDARSNFFQKLGKTGLSDVEYVEGVWMPEVLEYADMLEPVPSDLKDRWLDWKVDAATDAEGNLVGYGTDIGPLAICYRSDLFEAAGLPGGRDEVAALLEGDWAHFFEVGDTYVAATGQPFFDSARGVWQGMVNQIEEAYEDPATGEITATENADVRDAYDQLTAASATQSAGLSQWSDDWYAAMATGGFAAMLCPAWMLGVIEGNAPDVTTWDVANVFPNGGGNWGGSYVVVPKGGANVEAAQKFAEWLTAPAQQLKYFENAGPFPSQIEAMSSPALLSTTNGYFNDAPIGQIFSDRAQAIDVSAFQGTKYFAISSDMGDAITRVEDGIQDPETSWNEWVAKVESLR